MSFNAKKLVNIFGGIDAKNWENITGKVLSKIVLKCTLKCLIINSGQNPCPPTEHFKTPQNSAFEGFFRSKTLQKSKIAPPFSKICRK